MEPKFVTAIIACLGTVATWFKARTGVSSILEEHSEKLSVTVWRCMKTTLLSDTVTISKGRTYTFNL